MSKTEMIVLAGIVGAFALFVVGWHGPISPRAAHSTHGAATLPITS